MITKITEEELEFMECLSYAPCFAECVFDDLDNLTKFTDEEYSEIRLYQYPLLSFEYLLGYDPARSEKENFKLKERMGTIYCFGSRKIGKTLIVEEVDLLMAIFHNDSEKCGFSSFDAMHIRTILENVIRALENHPLFQMLEAKVNRSPTYRLFTRNGFCLDGINMNLTGENPGDQYFGKHLTRLYMEEASFETDKVYKKRLDAIAEDGCVVRLAGMTNFTKHCPTGKIFYELSNRPWIANYPQYINPKWGIAEKARAIKEHGGESSLSYKIFVLGEVVEDGYSAMDMERVRKNYNDKKAIKHIEITKEHFPNYEFLLSVVERPSNSNTLYIASDIGENVTEIIVISEVNNNYQYCYNITLYNLTDKEQFRIFKFLGIKLKGNFIALDCTEGTARAIFRSLEEVFPKQNLNWVGFNEKIEIGVAKDDNDREIFEDGKPVFVEEYVDAWSIKRLRDLFYEEGRVEIPMDYKFDTQVNSIIVTQSGNRTLYTCTAPEDHLLAAWRVFAISEWKNYLTINKPINKKQFCKSGV